MDSKTTELIIISAILTVIIVGVIVWKVKEYLGETTGEERKARRLEGRKAVKDFFKTCIKWTYLIFSAATVTSIIKVCPIWEALWVGTTAAAIIGVIGYFLFKWLGIGMDDKNDGK